MAGGRGMPFTSEQMQQVFRTNMIDFVVGKGYEIEKGSRHSVHVKHSGGLYLFNHGRGYYCFSTKSKGNIIDFAKEYFGVDFIGAVEMILGTRAYEVTEHVIPPKEVEPRKPLVLPQKDSNYNRVIAYLTKTRGISKEIVYDLIKEKKIYQAKTTYQGRNFSNCAFVGYDETGVAKYCAIRSMNQKSNFRQDITGSNKSYGFTMSGTSNRVYEFEAPIDAMSHATLMALHGYDWREDHRVAEGCLSDRALERYLQSHPSIKEIVFCYDNDVDGQLADKTPCNHGQEQASAMCEKYQKKGYEVFVQEPKTKDFNGDLLHYLELSKEETELEELEQ